MNLKNLSLGKQISLLVVLVSLLMFIASVTVAVYNIKTSLTNASEQKIDEITEIAHSIAIGYNQMVKAGELSESEAKLRAKKEIESIKYQKINYLWILDDTGKIVSHPTIPIGSDAKLQQDKKGIYFAKELLDSMKDGKSDYIEYYWTKSDSNKLYPKISVARAVPEMNWIVVTGIYVDEIDLIVREVFIALLVSNLLIMLAIITVVALTYIKSLTANMNALSNDLGRTSAQVSDASFHLESSSQKLAEGSTEQAASIQEVSATIEETSSMVKKNNENTAEAAKLAKMAKESAAGSHFQMESMMDSMKQIQSSSNEISKIIKVIDDIAFQTNILALNAAVEAARAGDAGKGFAVVAEEVRNLAQRSTQSAKDTTDLIENNISLSKNGVELASMVNDSITSIDDQSRKVSELLDEIATATNEQALGVEQINKAISQMEDVLQGTAQTAEDTAAASQQLSAQSGSMNNIVERLSKIVNGENHGEMDSPYSGPTIKPNSLLTNRRASDVKRLNDNFSDF